MREYYNQRILIISLNAIGDSYLSSSVLNLCGISHLNNNYNIVTLSDAKFIIENIDYKNRIYVNKKNIFSILYSIFKVLFHKYDLAFNFFEGRVNTLFFLVCRAKIKIGYINFKKVKDWSLKTSKIYFSGIKSDNNLIWNPEMNFMDKIKLALKPLNIDTKDLNKLKFSNLIQREDEIAQENILINYDSRIPGKRINIKVISQLIQSLLNCGMYNIHLIDNNKRIKDERITIHKELDLNTIISLFNKCKLFITSDSFLIHLADAYNIKTLGIFFDTNPESVFYNYKDKFWLKLKQNSDDNAEIIFNKVKELLIINENN